MTPDALHPCARCARVRETCCQRTDILVTLGDVDRIARHTGSKDFSEWRRPVDAGYLEEDPDDPEWIALTVSPEGTRRMLLHRPNGDCTFLGEAGCTLPGDVRPLVCRLYPWTFDHRGIHGEKPEYCPVAMLAPDGRPMVEVLRMDLAEARAWHRMLYDELRKERRSCVSA